MSTLKRRSSPSAASASSSTSNPKRVRVSTPPPAAVSLHSWLHPEAAPTLQAQSPALHDFTSTFLAFSLDFTPPAHITTDASLLKEVRRLVRELDVPRLVGPMLLDSDEGAFQDGEGRQASKNGKERAREPDHRMWAVRAVVLKEGRDGTKGEDDYHLLEASHDDGEKFGGERVLKVVRENAGMDVITVCCRWYGGDMLGPIRFQHICITARTSLLALQTSVTLRDLRLQLAELDAEIASMRATINPPSSPLRSVADTDESTPKVSPYDAIADPIKLRRLVVAREKTKAALEQKAAWAGMERSKADGAGGAE